jgi:protein-S-isoprenylcysteine O-methyltransferase Ste14
MEPAAKQNAHPWVWAIHRAHTYLSQDFLGGPKFLKLAWVINLHKGGTALFVAFLMILYRNNSTAAWVYLALHGTYGLCWLLKHANFPDAQWERRVTIGGAMLAVVFVLGPYWLFPYLLISGVLGPEHPHPSNALLATAIALHTLGVGLMMSADAQKYYTLKYRPGLIQEGLFKHVRHPNYLGEMLSYGAYALLIQHWIPWVILAYIWAGVFWVNMLIKEASLARYPEWEAYKARTGILLPRLWTRRKPAPPPTHQANVNR